MMVMVSYHLVIQFILASDVYSEAKTVEVSSDCNRPKGGTRHEQI